MPALAEARFAHYLCAPESFTPDGNFLLGETAEVAGLFVAAGMNSQGIILGPGDGTGAGRVDRRRGADRSTQPTSTCAASRRSRPARGYLFERTRESLGRLYAMHWPHLQPGTARGLRRVPLYDRLAAAGACFGEAAGWERAIWYARPGERPEYEYSFGRQNWFGAVADEHQRRPRGRRAVRPLLVRQAPRGRAGRAHDGPARLHRRPRPAAGKRRLHLHAQRARRRRSSTPRSRGLDEDAFLVVTSATAQTRAFHWLRRHARPAAVVTDVTSGFGVLSVTGPRVARPARRASPRRTQRRRLPVRPPAEIDVGRATALALRISFTGELGWELYVPVESLPVLYEQLVAAGARLRTAARRLPRAGRPARREGLRPLGRGRRAGRHAVRGRPGRHGRDGQAGRLRRPRGPRSPPERRRRRLVPILLADPEPQLFHGESRAAGRPRGRSRHVRRLRPHARRGRRARPPRRRRRPSSTPSSPAATWRSRSPASACPRG